MLRVEKLNYEVKGRKLLKDISFQVRKGEVLALLGANGAGKSTLMKVLCGEYKPSAGVISLNGKSLASFDPRVLAKHRAMLSQQQQVSLAFKVEEIVMMGRYPHFKTKPSIHDIEIVKEVMGLCGVDDFADRVFMSLSGGEQQRVQLARSLAQVWDNPESLLLLDEPISALDMHYQQKVLAIAKALSRRGFIVVIVVHDVNFAATYADRIIMLKHGRKLFDGTPIEVLNTQTIYTVFSVEAAVELNPKTLRPYVRLEEMPLDIYAFNSKLPGERAESLSIRQKRAQLLAKSPYLDLPEQAKRLGTNQAELWFMDKGRELIGLDTRENNLFSVLSQLGEVDMYTENVCCKQKQRHNYVEFDHVDATLVFHAVDSCQAVLVKTNAEESIHFFDSCGNVLHGLYLLAERSNKEAFDHLANQSGLSTTNFASMPSSKDECADADISSVASNQLVEFDYVKRILAQCAHEALPAVIIIRNDNFQQRYQGLISQLVDQGSRYMIKEGSFELVIKVDLLGATHVYTTLENTPSTRPYIELTDQEGNIVLQIKAPDDCRESQWEALFAKEIIIYNDYK